MSEIYYKIHNGKVFEIEEIVGRCVNADDFLKNLSLTTPIQSGRLPSNCIFFEKSNKGTVFVLQTTPRVAPLRYRQRGAGEATTFKLSLPFLQYWVKTNSSDAIESVWLSCTAESIEDNTQLKVLPVPNQYSNGNSYMCTGDIKLDLSLPLHKRIDSLLAQFWASNFNDDLMGSWPTFLNYTENGMVYSGFQGWEKHSAANPLCGLTFPYSNHSQRNFQTMVNTVRNGRGGM